MEEFVERGSWGKLFHNCEHPLFDNKILCSLKFKKRIFYVGKVLKV